MRFPKKVAVAVAVVTAVGVAVAATALGSTTPRRVHHRGPLTVAQIVADSSQSVVRIVGKNGGGSGFVINGPDQLVLTNDHVVKDNDGLTVQIGNNPSTTTPAEVVAESPCDDMAVIKLVDPVPGLKALPLGNAASVKDGDPVTVLGFPGSLEPATASNPFGQSTHVTSNTGTVSAVGVSVGGDGSDPNYPDTIEHQAPVNPGNSGGPLLDSSGHVIGMNTFSNSGAQGQYYSISIDLIKRILPNLEAGQSRANLGWDLVQLSYQDPNLSGELQQLLQLNAKASGELASYFRSQQLVGMYDAYDEPGSPADKAASAGDLIIGINENTIQAMPDVCSIVTGATPAQTLSVQAVDLNPADSTFLQTVTYDVKVPRN